jgi:cystathionine beta-lyase/cystathionine gamma-synthase
MITTYPLSSISLEQAKQMQFRIVDSITHHFNGYEILTQGDLGVVLGLNQPTFTQKAESVFAEIFDTEAAALVRGAGTGAIRMALLSFLKSGSKLLIHQAPIYETTHVTLESMGIVTVEADYNDLDQIRKVIKENPDLSGALVQITRQKIDDRYNHSEVIRTIKEANPSLIVITDDNYAAMKIDKIGVQCGADLSTFSCFKLQGPEGVGCVIGKKELIAKIHKYNYSGGCQVQGHEALAALRGICIAPVLLAIQAEVNEELVRRLSNGEIPQIKQAFLANAQSKVLLVEFQEEIAEELLKITPSYGAAAHPVGAESRYEIAPMFYRVSGTFRAQDPSIGKRMIRINPMRSGPDTIIRIIKSSLLELENNKKR